MWLPAITGSSQSLKGEAPSTGYKDGKEMKCQYEKGMAEHLLVLL